MAEFMSASMRAAGADLTIAISPLGLIELSDEEFEVHGPRLTRYAQNWAFYLGHHWAYRRVAGEPQLVFNYCMAMSNYLNNFAFGKGFSVQADRRVQHIVPALVERILTRDNKKKALLWSVGQLGGVSGDAFVKVAYDPASWMDNYGDVHSIGDEHEDRSPSCTELPNKASCRVFHEGRVRILPLNPAFCFPEWAPHDMDLLLRFKLKYRFWATAPEGTRQVYTYTEILTDEVIEEYINDQLISQRENPLGEIPVVHIANKPAASSPWGLSDIQDILPLNRAYNETATEILDIINYYTAPVTIVTGHKASNMERGANKLWGITNKDAKVYNLEGGAEGLPQALEFLTLLEHSMHKMTGIPVTALGEEQAISNTSGVALYIQFFPLMMAYSLKTTQYEDGWKRILYFALRTLFMAEPDSLLYDPATKGILEDPDVQADVIDPSDPVTYDLEIRWPPPFPTDLVVKLNEIMMKMQMGLESKVGALLELGEEYPSEKRQELWEQQILEAKMDGAAQLIKAEIAAAVAELTGIVPEGMGEPVPPPPTATPNADGQSAQPIDMPKPPALGGLGDLSSIVGKLGGDTLNELVTQAHGTKIPQTRQIDKNDND
jgi:hypothetical protein